MYTIHGDLKYCQSNIVEVKTGVPRGSVSGPILSIITAINTTLDMSGSVHT